MVRYILAVNDIRVGSSVLLATHKANGEKRRFLFPRGLSNASIGRHAA
jgi:hypothetical protein